MDRRLKFTVLLPVVRPPIFLGGAIQTVLTQTLEDFELVIVCDGAPASTIEAAHEWARSDDRVSALVRPKGARHGEAHRHEALCAANGLCVAHIDDDGLWFPDHLAMLAALLSRADFAHTTHARVLPDGVLKFGAGNLANEASRQAMSNAVFNWFGIANAGYRLACYRALPLGWDPAPQGVPTDLHMWRKLVAEPSFSFATSLRITSLFLDRIVGDDSEDARRQHADLVARALAPESTFQADVEAAFHQLLLARWLADGAVEWFVRPACE